MIHLCSREPAEVIGFDGKPPDTDDAAPPGRSAGGDDLLAWGCFPDLPSSSQVHGQALAAGALFPEDVVVPWRPRDWTVVPDSRFDPYRERAGRLSDRGVDAGIVFVRLRPCVMSTGGALWWRRWSEAFEEVHEYVLLAGDRFTEAVTNAGDLDDEVRDWAAGRFSLTGDTLRVEWLDDVESLRVRLDVFGLGPR